MPSFTKAKNQLRSFPAVPPFLSAGNHETRDYYTERDESRPHINQAPYLTPYLGLRARLSQVWINRWTVLLLLVLVRTLLAIAGLNDNLDSARTKALSACTSVESVGSAMASMPHYLSQGVNELAASGIEKAVSGLESMLMLSITAVEEIIIFIINMLTQTYVCLITLAVSGSLHAAVELISAVTKFLDEHLNDITNEVVGDISSFQSKVSSFLDSFVSLPFGGGNKPTIDEGKIKDALKIQLPDDLDADLQKLNSSIPDFKDVNDFTQKALRLPFDEIKKLINGSLGTYAFDRSVFPVPQKEKLSFCTGSNGINDFFEDLFALVYKAKKIFLAVIIILAVLACIPMAYREIRRWRTMQKRAQLVTKEATDPMDVVYIASRPYTAGFGLKLSNGFQSTRRQHLVRWAVAYATTTPALFVLSLALAGLFSCLCQIILLRAIQGEVPALSGQVGAFAEKVVFALDNASTQWAVGVNGVIGKTNDEINNDVFGWVETSTTAVNDTLNTFVDEMSKGLDAVFGDTILKDAIADVLNCLIGLKIQGIQKGITWVHDNAHVSFPRLSPDTFSLGAAASLSNDSSVDSFLASPGSKSRDEISDAVESVVRKFQAAIRQEAILAACLLIIWVFIALIGIFRALMLFFGRDKTRAEGGQNYSSNRVTNFHQAQENRPYSVAPPYEESVNSNHSRHDDITPILATRNNPIPNNNNNEKFGAVSNGGYAVTADSQQRQSSHARLTGDPYSLDEKSRNRFI